MLISCVAATTNKFEANGMKVQFTINILKMLADSSARKPVTDGFDYSKPTLGYVKHADVKDDKLELVVDFFLDFIGRCKGLYISPSFQTLNFVIMEYGITTKPADKSLPEILIS